MQLTEKELSLLIDYVNTDLAYWRACRAIAATASAGALGKQRTDELYALKAKLTSEQSRLAVAARFAIGGAQ